MYDYRFELPFPPTVNHFHMPVRMGRGVRIIKSNKVTQYQTAVAKVMRELNLADEKIKERIRVHLVMHPKTRAKFDCSNYLKAYEDALMFCGFIEDDSQIIYGSIDKGEPVKGGKLVVKIELLGDE